MTRILLFLGTNMAVMVVFSIITSIFGLDKAIGQSPVSLIIFASLFGFIGSVHAQAKASGIGLPDVGIFQQNSPNAFATGWNKNNSLVAVSTGLLQTMSKEEVEAVLGHEVAHVYNGDMVTMGLIQGVLNTFVIIFSRILGSMIDNALRGNRSGGGGFGMGYFIGNILGNVVFGFLASLIAAWFSRQREFRADAGGAELAGRENMISALEALKRGSQESAALPERLQAFGISGGALSKMASTHPPLDVRIARLRADA